MKTCIILLVLGFACINAVPSEKHNAELASVISNCAKDSKASEKDLSDYHGGKLQGANVPEPVKCFIKCFMEKVGLIDVKTGEFSPESLKMKFAKYINDGNRKDLEEALVKCNALKGSSPCDTAFLISGCMSTVKMQIDD